MIGEKSSLIKQIGNNIRKDLSVWESVLKSSLLFLVDLHVQRNVTDFNSLFAKQDYCVSAVIKLETHCCDFVGIPLMVSQVDTAENNDFLSDQLGDLRYPTSQEFDPCQNIDRRSYPDLDRWNRSLDPVEYRKPWWRSSPGERHRPRFVLLHISQSVKLWNRRRSQRLTLFRY